jgi:acetyl esterase/lipase
LRAHAKEYSLNPDLFAAAGGSSGGNYVCMICTTAHRPELEDPGLGYPRFSAGVQCGVAWYPPTDFLMMDEHLRESGLGPCNHGEANSPESRLLGGQITALPPEKVQAANPTTYVHPNMPPMFIEHGRKDHVVPWQQSKLFVEKIKQIAGQDKVKYEILEEADHADRLFETDENMNKVFDFVNKTLGR